MCVPPPSSLSASHEHGVQWPLLLPVNTFCLLTLEIVAKTRTQLNRHLPTEKKLPWPPFGRQWYAGCTTLIVGNSIKAGVRMSPLRPSSKSETADKREKSHRTIPSLCDLAQSLCLIRWIGAPAHRAYNQVSSPSILISPSSQVLMGRSRVPARSSRDLALGSLNRSWR